MNLWKEEREANHARSMATMLQKLEEREIQFQTQMGMELATVLEDLKAAIMEEVKDEEEEWRSKMDNRTTLAEAKAI